MSRIINLDEIDLQPLSPAFAASGEAAHRYSLRVAMLGAQPGAQKLSYNVIALPPGKRGFPFHCHRVNEEMFLVIAGRGEIRIGDARVPIRPGDVIACPAGGPETAHQIINTGDVELRHLALSTKLSPDIIEYPDSGKYKVTHECTSDDDSRQQSFQVIGRQGEAIDYREGE